MNPVTQNAYVDASDLDRSGRFLVARAFAHLDSRPAPDWLWPRRRRPTLRFA
jgi:hypothetical protein